MNDFQPISYLRGFIPYALAAFLVGLVGGLTTVLGPAFVQDMNLAYNNTTWTALAIATSSAVCAPILGKLSDVLGRRITLLLGISIFVLGNVLTAVAGSLVFMLFARFVVGIGTAAIAPTVMSYIVTEFPPQAIAKGFSLYMLISSSAVIFGPSLGGLILEAWDWRVLMWVCVFISALFLILCFLTHPYASFTPKKMTNFDGLGAVFVIAFFSLLLCIPSFGQNFGWLSSGFLLVLILAPLALIGLIVSEKHAENPILSGRFMKRRSFILPVMILFLTQGLMQANMTNVIVFVNYTQPDNTVISGYAISIMYLGMSLGSIFLGPLADRFEPKRILTVSLILTAIGCGIMLFFSPITSVVILASALGILGFGLGANATIFMKIVLSDLPANTAGSGTGIYGLFRDLAAPFGVAVFVPLFTNQITRLVANAPAQITSQAAAVSSIHTLALIELCCIAAGIIIVQLLPKIHHN
ncbi:MAG: MFS transporter [Lachnospiraceae bacterium]|nr:MFS transporter [Lachnospiraceae bacterium]